VDLKDKRVLLSGATGGLGRAIAEELAGHGAKLILSSRKKDDLQELAKSLPGGARRHQVIVADLAKPGAAEKLAKDAGNVDALIANAALPASGKLEDFVPNEVERALRVNFESPILMAHAIAPKLAKKGEGHVVFMSSLSGKVGSPRASLYNATKFGLRGFTFGLREDMRPHGAGMWADAEVDPPPMVGTTTPKKVAQAVVRAIERNRNEITVAPMRQRFIAEVGYRHPEFAGRVQRRGGADRIADELAAGQANKR
jgi:short-subunit dehydrogenase